jgi:hypothetical protein
MGGKLDIANILAELRQEHEHLEEAILALERLAAGGKRRRGRPPAWMANLKNESAEKPRSGRPSGSENRTDA